MQTVRTNLFNGTPMQWTNFDFQSMTVFNGVILGAGDQGVRKLCCGTDDAGTAIQAYIIGPTTDFGENGPKRPNHVYANIEGGDAQISITGDGKTTEGPYLIDTLDDEGAQRRRASLGKGLKFHYASCKIENINGSSFSLADAEMSMSVGKRNY